MNLYLSFLALFYFLGHNFRETESSFLDKAPISDQKASPDPFVLTLLFLSRVPK